MGKGKKDPVVRNVAAPPITYRLEYVKPLKRNYGEKNRRVMIATAKTDAELDAILSAYLDAQAKEPQLELQIEPLPTRKLEQH
jgi:hypothetical protein